MNVAHRISHSAGPTLLLSIRPRFVDAIFAGKKTVELRRRFPRTASEVLALIYCTNPVMAVVGLVYIRKVEHLSLDDIWRSYGIASSVSEQEFEDYFDGLRHGFALAIENPVTFQKPLDRGCLQEKIGFVPPQSFMYVSEELARLVNNEPLQNIN